jgi:hypothetical protein
MKLITNLLIPTKQNNYKPHLLKRVAVIAYSIILVSVNSFGGLLGIGYAQASSITPENIINLTNKERIAWGLNTLQSNPQLSAAALAKANDMFEKQYWDHFGPNGESPWQFIRAAGYDYVYAGENLAKGFRTAEGVHEAWMASPTHKENIISGNYKDIGVAVLDGELLGKQTTLVVQMFGNLTSEVQGSAQTPPSEESAPAPEAVPSSESKVVVNRESGEIKSIRITSPQEGAMVNDASTSIRGETTNVTGEYIVEVYDQATLIGDTTSESSEWEFSRESDWEEGEHTVKAGLKDEDIFSEEVSFMVASKAPLVDSKSILVEKSNSIYFISFAVEGEWKDITLLIGSKIVEIEYEADGNNVTFQIDKEEVKGSVVVMLENEYGNSSKLDISEYFIEKESGRGRFLPFVGLSLGDTISVGIVGFVLLLLIIEIAVYWRRGRLKDVMGEIFAIGVWWLILTMAILNGFSGVIN